MVELYSYIYDTLTCFAHQYTCIYSLQNFKGRVIRQYYKKSYFCVKFDQIIISVSLMWSYFRKIQLSKFLVTYLIIFFFKPLTHGLYFVTITIWWWGEGLHFASLLIISRTSVLFRFIVFFDYGFYMYVLHKVVSL